MATLATDRHYLAGDWTLTGVTKQLGGLSSSLQKLKSANHKCVHIDCSKIEAIDLSGLELLRVWVELLKIHGVEPNIDTFYESHVCSQKLFLDIRRVTNS